MTIVIISNTDVQDADTVRLALLDALRPHADVTLDITDEGEPSFAFLQVIEAARCQAESVGARLSLLRPAQGPLLAALGHAGLLDPSRPPACPFWTHGATPA